MLFEVYIYFFKIYRLLYIYKMQKTSLKVKMFKKNFIRLNSQSDVFSCLKQNYLK